MHLLGNVLLGLVRWAVTLVWAALVLLALFVAAKFLYFDPKIAALNPPDPRAAQLTLARPYTPFFLLGSLVLTVGLKMGGLLPGASVLRPRRPTPAEPPHGPADAADLVPLTAEPAAPPARRVPVVRPVAESARQVPVARPAPVAEPVRRVAVARPAPSPTADLPSVHRPTLRGTAIRFLGQFGIGGLFAAIGLLLIGTAAARPGSGMLPPGVGFVLVGLAVAGSVALMPKSVGEVRLTADGLAWVTGGREYAYGWDEVASVRRVELTVNDVPQHRTEVAFRDGRRVTFDLRLGAYGRLAETIQEMTAARFLPAARTALGRYGAEFGPVTLRRDGIGMAGDFFPWDRIGQLVVWRGTLLLLPAGGSARDWKEEMLMDVPDYLVLFHLLDDLGRSPTFLRRDQRPD